MSGQLPASIVTALAQFPSEQFCARDICRRFKEAKPVYIMQTLKRLVTEGRLQRRLRYGVFRYSA